MTTAAQGDPPPSLLLGPVLSSLPADLCQQEVLRRLGPRALASLARAGRGCAAAVAATALMQWAERAKRAPPFHGYHLPPLCLKEACSLAAGGGNREVLEWLHSTGCPWNAETASAAAGGGHLEVLLWAREHGCPWDRWTCARRSVRATARVRVLQWAWEHHCPWDCVTPASAAYGGHLAVLQWARENDATGEAWSENTVRRYAAGPRQQEVLTRLDELSGL